MAVSFGDLPLEIYTGQIIRYLDYNVRSLCAFGLTSKTACQIIRNISQHRGDITLKGERVRFICEENTTIKACVFQILKISVLLNHPELFKDLSSRDQTKKIAAMVPFGFQTRKVDATSLSHALPQTICERKIDLAELMLAHPESINIPSKSGKKGTLGHALIEAVSINSLELAQTILLLPNAKNIPGRIAGRPCNMYDLDHVLNAAFIVDKRSEFIKLVLSHPNATEISEDTLSGILMWAIYMQDPTLVLKIAHHPNAKRMPKENREIYHHHTVGLTTHLSNAVFEGNPQVIAAVLHHPVIIFFSESDLYSAGRAMLSDEDREKLLQLQEMLEQKPFRLKEVATTFINLSAAIQRFVYLMLCKEHGCRTGKISREGMVHFIKRTKSLLPIIRNLSKAAHKAGD